MSNNSKSFHAVFAALVLPLILAACGGGGGGGSGDGGGGATPPPGGGGGGTPPPSPTTPLPVAMPDTVSTERNKPLTVTVLANDVVSNGGTLTLASATAPQHGTATVSGSNVVYTPATGYFGPDSFSYSINAGPGSVTATAQVSVSVQAPLTLAGRVLNSPANATAAVMVGATSYTAALDANGNFSTPVKLDAPATMVSVVVRGSGSAATSKLISLLGDSQALVDAAGTKVSISADDLPGLNVNNVSTALYALASRENGGAVPATQLAFETAAGGVAVSELFQMATVVRMLTPVAGAAAQLAMPAGAADTVALTTNAALYTQFAKQTLQASADLLQAETEITRADTRLASVPAIKTEASKSLNFYTNEGCCTAAGAEVILNPDGTASFYKSASRAAATYTRSNGSLVLTLTSPHVSSEYFNRLVSPFGQYEVRFTTKQVTIQQFTGFGGKGFVRLTQSGTTHYPTGEEPDSTFSTVRLYAFSEWSTLSAPADVAGSTFAGLIITPNPLDIIVNQQIVTFAADGSATSAQLPGTQIAWKIEAGKLVVNFPASQHAMARVRVNADGGERWLVRVGYGQQYTVEEAMVVKVQPNLALTETSVINGWLSGGGTGAITSGFIINVLPNYVSNDATVSLGGTVTPVRQTSWIVQGGALVMSSYLLADNTTSVATCPGGQTCTLGTERTWTLLRDNPSAIYVYEKVRFAADDIRYRVNRYARTKP